jgi:hypothetical protein
MQELDCATLASMPLFPLPWWAWPPRNWELRRLLQTIDRESPPPVQFLTAKTVYIQKPVGETLIEGVACAELQKWRQFEVVTDPREADLTLTFSSKPQGMTFDAWYDGDPTWHWLKDAHIDESIGYCLLKVTNRETETLERFVEISTDDLRQPTRNLIRNLRRRVKRARAWYERNR